MSPDRSLKELRAEFGQSRFLAMPIAGAVAWSAAAGFGAVLNEHQASIALFLCLPAIFPLGMLLARFTGEDLFATNTRNELDSLFLLGLLMSNLVWAIAIPFWMMERSSLPLTAGILTGLMWVPFSWIIEHWVGYFHAVTRTLLVMAAWFAIPQHRFVVIPLIIVVIYLITIVALAARKRPEPIPPD